MNKKLLYLASSSPSRKKLLEDAKIPFTVITQTADESHCEWALPLDILVTKIAHYKMEHVHLPAGKVEGEICFVLTADTLSQDSNGVIQKKPIDRADAKYKIQGARNGASLSTAFCLEKNIWHDGRWHMTDRIDNVVSAKYRFIIPDTLIDYYLDNSIGLKTAGAIAVEDFGLQFLESIEGSYSTIIGLPLFELRVALTELGFFE
jgi:septum formation protein